MDLTRNRDELPEFAPAPEAGASLQEVLSDTGRNIFIHGAGNFGTATCKLLEDAGYRVSGFIDRRAGDLTRHLDKPVFRVALPSQESPFDPDRDVVVLGFICGEAALRAELEAYRASGYRRVYYFLDLYSLLLTGKLAADRAAIFHLTPARGIPFGAVSQRALQVAELWEDQESRSTYRSFLQAVHAGNSDLFAAATLQPQYFVDDIPFQKGYRRFIDCGAFDGDTALALKTYRGTSQSLACFEPDLTNFRRLSRVLAEERVAEEQVLFPCGVWDRTEMLRFRSGQQSTSGISDAGDSHLQCVSLDEAIPDFRPTFVKMDVEGAEYEALLGARQLLRSAKPDLAISVYHRIEHMWEIPLLIKEICPEYRFYLRSHAPYGVETVMYATAPEGAPVPESSR